MGVEQSAISRLEGHNDCLLATLKAYIEALGGKLEIKACFPDEAQSINLLTGSENLSHQV